MNASVASEFGFEGLLGNRKGAVVRRVPCGGPVVEKLETSTLSGRRIDGRWPLFKTFDMRRAR